MSAQAMGLFRLAEEAYVRSVYIARATERYALDTARGGGQAEISVSGILEGEIGALSGATEASGRWVGHRGFDRAMSSSASGNLRGQQITAVTTLDTGLRSILAAQEYVQAAFYDRASPLTLTLESMAAAYTLIDRINAAHDRDETPGGHGVTWTIDDGLEVVAILGRRGSVDLFNRARIKPYRDRSLRQTSELSRGIAIHIANLRRLLDMSRPGEVTVDTAATMESAIRAAYEQYSSICRFVSEKAEQLEVTAGEMTELGWERGSLHGVTMWTPR